MPVGTGRSPRRSAWFVRLLLVNRSFVLRWLQVAHGGALGSSLTAGDFLVHHAIALGLHVTSLVLLKSALNARGSKLMPDKAGFGYGFP